MSHKYLIFSIISFVSTISSISFDSLKLNGYIEIANPYFLKKDYNKIYHQFENFIEIMTNDSNYHQTIYHSEKKFSENSIQKKRYCSAPPSYRDPKKNPKKRHNKIYFQYIDEHYQILKQNYSDLLNKKPGINSFLNSMYQIDKMSKKNVC